MVNGIKVEEAFAATGFMCEYYLMEKRDQAQSLENLHLP